MENLRLGMYLLMIFFFRMTDARNLTCIWKDKWYGDCTLKDSFPKLYKLEVDKNLLVSDKIKGHSEVVLKGVWKRDLKYGVETEELDI